VLDLAIALDSKLNGSTITTKKYISNTHIRVMMKSVVDNPALKTPGPVSPHLYPL